MTKILILISVFLLVSCDKKKDAAALMANSYDSIRLVSYDRARIGNDLQIENNPFSIRDIKFVDDLILDDHHSHEILRVLLSKPAACSMADCYNPRHILLFYKQDRITGFYEFCAACGGSKKSDNIDLQPICSEQGDALIEIFKEMKLKNDGEEGENYEYF